MCHEDCGGGFPRVKSTVDGKIWRKEGRGVLSLVVRREEGGTSRTRQRRFNLPLG